MKHPCKEYYTPSYAALRWAGPTMQKLRRASRGMFAGCSPAEAGQATASDEAQRRRIRQIKKIIKNG
jgi:hypothetical protein